MTKKHDDDEPVLGTGALGDPQEPDAVKPVGYESLVESPDEKTEKHVSGRKKDDDK